MRAGVWALRQAVTHAIPSWRTRRPTPASARSRRAARQRPRQRLDVSQQQPHQPARTAAKDDPWIDVGLWMVPVDDEHTARLNICCGPSTDPETDARFTAYFNGIGTYNPAEHHDELFVESRCRRSADAAHQRARLPRATRPGRHRRPRPRDARPIRAGVALLRRIFTRELDALQAGRALKGWNRLEETAELPIQHAGGRT